MPPISHPPPTRRRLAAASAVSALFLFLFLLLPTLLPSAAAQPASTPPSDESSFPTLAHFPFNPSVATGVMVAAIFFLVFLSAYAAYVLHCSPAPEGSIGRDVRSLRSLAAPLGLEPAVVETFPTVVYSAMKVHKSGVASLECAVCLNDFEDDDTLRLLPKCDHAFHPDCIGAWLASHTTCPVCRADLASQPAGDSEGQQAEPGAEPPQVEGTPPDAGAPEGSQREGEREGNQPPDLGDMSESGSSSNPNRTRGASRMRGLPRSHSTGHSLVRPGEDTERFTLRLPAEVRKQLMDRPGPVLPPECCSRRGYRCGGEGSSRGRYFRRRDWQDRLVKLERWAFNFFVRLSPRVAADDGGGSSRGSLQQARPAI